MPSFTTSEPKQGGAFTLLEPGEYSFSVIDAVEKTSTNGNAMIELKLRVGDHDNIVFDNLVFTPKAAWKIDQFLKSAGGHPGEGKDITIEADDCLGQKGLLEIKKESYQHNGETKIKNTVSGYLWEEF